MSDTSEARIWTVQDGDRAVDVELIAHDAATVADVLPAVGRVLGRPVDGLWQGTRRLPDHCRLGAPELAHGAVLGAAGPAPRRDGGGPSSALELHVVGGPAAGVALPLDQGRHVIGRGDEASIRLDDPDVSRNHVVVQVGGGAITVADLGSTNGSRVDGHDLGEEPADWRTGAVLRLGASAVTLAGPSGTTASVEPSPGGRLRLRPTPHLPPPPVPVEVVFPKPPAAVPRRRLAWVAVALPAVGGVLMAWLLDAPTFLFFALLSPVVALGTWLSERWSGRRSGRRDAAAHALAVTAAEARVAAAVRADVRLSATTHPDPATVTTAARRRSALLWSRRAGTSEDLPVRVGTGPGDTRVTRVDADGARIRERARHLPVVVDLGSGGGLAVVGPREQALGVLATVVAQLVTLHPPGDVDLVLLTERRRLPDWTWARWLPHLDRRAVHVQHAAAHDEDLHAWLTGLIGRRRTTGAGRPEAAVSRVGRVVVVVDRVLDPRIAATLLRGRDAGLVPLTCAETVDGLPVPVDTRLELGGETGNEAVLSRPGTPDLRSVTVDRMPRTVATALARDLARLVPAGTATDLPRSVRLLDLPARGIRLNEGGTLTGAWSPARDRLVATLGRTAQRSVDVDLCRQGPHALVAGTTGSGKSELLQTLIAGLAANHPPDRCSFLLVDYKGGAAFAEAAGLPHTVGLVTDLDGQSTERALRSLGAELTRREAILAAHRVPDISALPDTVPLARLVIVVDEFAGLAEELPDFVSGLVGIAQRGRSLGVHLVLATQRPGGVVSPEIRANCTLRICLRTTDEADSRDVLGTGEAAHLPIDLPGRAYLRSGAGPATALQIARVATTAPPPSDRGPHARRRGWPEVPLPTATSSDRDGPSDLRRLCAALSLHATVTGAPLPHRPWRPALPDLLHPDGQDDGSTRNRAGTRLPIGLVDHPDQQAQEVLELDLARGGTWLVVGGPRSGRSTLLRTVLGEAVRRLGPDELHVHVLEASGGALATAAAALPHAGTTVGGEDAFRTVRLVDRLAQEVAARRAAPRPDGQPLILLLVDGVEAITALLDESDPGRGSANLLRLLRDGGPAGLTCVVTADRAVPGGRLAATARQRLVLPLPDRADYAVAGVAARAVPAHRPPGRALLGEDALECQLAFPRPPAPGAPWRRTSTPPPLRIAELLPDPLVPVGPLLSKDEGSLALPIGPGGDEGSPLVVHLLRSGGLLVSGPPGSGRSTTLDAFEERLASRGVAVVRIGRPGDLAVAENHGTPWLEPVDQNGMAGWLADLDGRPGVVIADDVGAPADIPVLALLAARGAGSRAVLLAAGDPGQLAAHYQGPVAALRRGRSGLLLCPGPGDADLVGVRLPRTPIPVRPGSGWLVDGPSVTRVQVARRSEPHTGTPPRGPEPAVRGGVAVAPQQRQRRSSAGPISWRAYQASS
ncbi:FHA domain-containing protein [Blastococcus sp. CT_GayMR20]|uniref:FtsK/SpoIIIE domain-containing protein n=1 Tax=Blastococcus sp. CT_GayMR20 TaxID=2559609 RepID=UPI0010744032|nr:FtsK/SpoIIIE domain-containing protein [Blastococcus sp. CT_GayMR20]TFV81256.1 FHA domain-containing protein [Blastococcus sp. CT_GayMR20]